MNRWWIAAAAVALWLVGLTISSGSVSPPVSFGIKYDSQSWTVSSDGISGIDDASLCRVTLTSTASRDATFVIWSDGPAFNTRFWSSQSGAFYESVCSSDGAKGMRMSGHITTEHPAAVFIAGNSYELKNGAIFCVAARSQPPRVLQLDMDPNQLPGDRDQLIELARSKEPIREFFEAETMKARAKAKKSDRQ